MRQLLRLTIETFLDCAVFVAYRPLIAPALAHGPKDHAELRSRTADANHGGRRTGSGVPIDAARCLGISVWRSSAANVGAA
jgi:hypothetical protein